MIEFVETRFAINELEKKYKKLEEIQMDWALSVMADKVLGNSRKQETEEETFYRVQKEFVCSIIQLGLSLELVRNGRAEYKDKIEQHFKEVDGNIRYKFPKGDLYYAANTIFGSDFSRWEYKYLKPGFFKRLKDSNNFEFWFRTWINICCDLDEYPFARYLAHNTYQLTQQIKGCNPEFAVDLAEFISQ